MATMATKEDVYELRAELRAEIRAEHDKIASEIHVFDTDDFFLRGRWRWRLPMRSLRTAARWLRHLLPSASKPLYNRRLQYLTPGK